MPLFVVLDSIIAFLIERRLKLVAKSVYSFQIFKFVVKGVEEITSFDMSSITLEGQPYVKVELLLVYKPSDSLADLVTVIVGSKEELLELFLPGNSIFTLIKV